MPESHWRVTAYPPMDPKSSILAWILVFVIYLDIKYNLSQLDYDNIEW